MVIRYTSVPFYNQVCLESMQVCVCVYVGMGFKKETCIGLFSGALFNKDNKIFL